MSIISDGHYSHGDGGKRTGVLNKTLTINATKVNIVGAMQTFEVFLEKREDR